MTPEELKERTTAFAINILDFSKTLRSRPENWEIARQLSDAATSVASNYRQRVALVRAASSLPSWASPSKKPTNHSDGCKSSSVGA